MDGHTGYYPSVDIHQRGHPPQIASHPNGQPPPLIAVAGQPSSLMSACGCPRQGGRMAGTWAGAAGGCPPQWISTSTQQRPMPSARHDNLHRPAHTVAIRHHSWRTEDIRSRKQWTAVISLMPFSFCVWPAAVPSEVCSYQSTTVALHRFCSFHWL